MAVTGAIIAGIGLATSIDAAQSSKRASERQAANIASQDATQRAIARRKAVRIQRIKRAQIEQSSINTGVAESSGEIAGVSGLASDFVITSGVLVSQKETSARSFQNARDISKANVKAAVGSSLQGVGMQVIGANLKGSPELSVDQEIDAMFNEEDLF